MLFRPARATDVEAICALLATAKHSAEYFYALLTDDPCFDPAQIRLAWTAGHIVACAKLYPRTLRIGTATLPAGGIGNVRTDPRYWHKGLATSLLSECLAAMLYDGMVLAPLFAERHTLFARRGWHVIPSVGLELPARALAGAAPSTTQVRPFEGADLDAVMALHESANAGRTGSAVRERDDWLARLTRLDLQGAAPLVAEREGEIAGYVCAQQRGQSCEILELLLAPWAETVWPDLLSAALDRCGGADTLRAILPADYRRLIYGALAPQAVTATADDLMLRAVDPVRLLEGLVPLLTARLRDAGDVAPLALRIGPLRGGAVLRVEGGSVAAERPRRDDAYLLPEETFLALLLGVEDAHARLDPLPLPDAVRATLLYLFPVQDWVFWRADAF